MKLNSLQVICVFLRKGSITGQKQLMFLKYKPMIRARGSEGPPLEWLAELVG